MPERTPFSSAKAIAVLGAGKSGVAAARLARCSCDTVWVLDGGEPDRLGGVAEVLKREGVTTRFGAAAQGQPPDVDLVVLSPGIDLRRPIVTQFTNRDVPLIGEIEFAFQHTEVPVVGITGTNGKTTTTEMAAAVFQGGGLRCVGAGNYGVPFSDIVRPDRPELDVIALEVSSFQLETITTFRPRVSVWLNFAPDHLDRYESLEDYRAAKLRIFEFQGEDDWAVVRAEDRPWLPEKPLQVRTFSASGPADLELREGWIQENGRPVLEYRATALRGNHNAENVMAVMAAARVFGIEPERVEAILRTYRPPAHRCEWVRTVGGHEFINDSKATNLHALESSLRGRTRPVVLIAGGKEKGLDYAEVAPLIEAHVSHALLIGEIAGEVSRAWEGSTTCRVCASLEEAVRVARDIAPEGEDILFSPGTSSFDLFSGYEERGDAFRRAVNELEV